MNQQAIDKLWENFCFEQGISDIDYDAFQMGRGATQIDELAQLVNIGKKTATSSAYLLYEIEQVPLPKENQYSIILNSDNEPVCIIRNSCVYVTTFDNVSKAYAFKEGEGDRSLMYWRQEHERFFKEALSLYNIDFSNELLVVCEEFEVVWRMEK